MAMFFKISKLRNVKVKIIIIMMLLIVYEVATYIMAESYVFKKEDKTPSLKLEYVVVHLDLKGAPPKLAYLKSILPMLKNHGVNGLLIEYEDMFPYEGRLKKLRAINCYKKTELQTYLTTAVLSGFEIIPLVQTFGHLEFALKLTEFAHLREDLKFSDAICPSSSESQRLLQEMLRQVIQFHQRITPLKHIHVGCDEVYHMNKCNRCQKRNFTKAEALTSHLNFVTKTVRNFSPESNILIWDDMYRDVKPLHSINLKFPKTEAVYWDYTPNLHGVAHTNMYKYNQMFGSLWVATAFKGADGHSEILPNLKTRFYNHLLWLNFILDYGSKRNLYNIKGIILTGWSRYKHADPLCELLPASIPSLVLNLILIEKYRYGIIVQDMSHVNNFIEQHIRSNLASNLECQRNLDYFLVHFDARSCNYKESDLYDVLENLSYKTKTIIEANAFKNHFNSSTDIKLQTRNEYTEERQAQMEVYKRILNDLFKIEDPMVKLLSDYFENYVIEEYIRTKIHHLANITKGLIEFWKHKDLMKSKMPDIKKKLNIS